MKKLSLILATLVITVLATVPAFAATPEEIVAAARADQEKRLADYLTYQQNLAAFQAQQVALGQAQAEAGKAAEAANFAAIAAFQQSQLQKQAEINARRAELQKQIDEYLRLVYSR